MCLLCDKGPRCPIGNFAEQTNSKRFPSSKFLPGHLGAFSESIQNVFPLRSSLLGIFGAFSQSRHIQNVFALRSSLSGILFAKQTHSKSCCCSKFPIGHLGAFSHSRHIQNAFVLRSSLLGILGTFRKADTFTTLFLFEAPFWASWSLCAEQTHLKRCSSSTFPIGHLGAFSRSRRIQNAFPLRSSLLGILGLVRRANTFKTFWLFEVPYWASWGLFAKQTHSKSCCCSKFPIGHLGAFSQSRHINNTFPLRSFQLGILGASRQADTFKALFFFEAPCRASWGLFTKQTHSKRFSSSKFPIGHLGAFSLSKHIPNVFPLRSSLLGILGPFRTADTFKTLLFFEVPYWASWGLCAEQTQSKHSSSSKFPIGHLGAFAQSRHSQNILPLRSSLLDIMGPFRKADTFNTLFLFEVPYWASWGLFAKQTHSTRFSSSKFPYWAFWVLFAEQTHSKRLLCSSKFPIGHFGAFLQSRRIQNAFSKFPIGHLGAFSQSRHIHNTFPLRSSLLGILEPLRRTDTFKTLFLFEVSNWASWGLFAKQKHSKRFSSSKFPIGHLGAFSQSRHIQSVFALRSSLSGILGPFRKADTFKTLLFFEVPNWASWGLFAKQTH